MTKIATIDWFGRWGTSVFSENTAIFSITGLSALSIVFGKPHVMVTSLYIGS